MGQEYLLAAPMMNRSLHPEVLPDKGPPTPEQRLADLSFELSAIPCLCVDSNGRHLRVNRAARELFGFTDEEFRDLSVCDVNLLIRSESLAGYWEKLKSAGMIAHAGLHLQRGGGAVPGRVHATYVEVDGRECGVMSILDVTELQRSQEAGRETEWLFKQIASSTEDVFWVMEVDSFAIRYVSPAFERIWQRSCKDLYQRPAAWLEAVVPQDREAVDRLLERVKRSEAVIFEYRIVRPDGSVRWIRDRSYPVSGIRGEQLACGVAEDVTLRKEAEIALQQAQVELEARVAGRTADLKAAAEQLGADLAERDRISAELAVSEARYRQRTAQLQQVNEEMRKEIQERIRITEALKASEGQFRSVAETSPEPIIIHSDCRIVFASRAAAELYGAQGSDELVGMDVFRLVHPDSHAFVRERVRANYCGENVPLMELRVRRLDGRMIEVEAAAGPLVFGGVPAAVVIVRDITRRKRAQAWREAQSRILELLATGSTRSAVFGEIVGFTETQLNDGLGSILVLDPCGKRLRTGFCGSLPDAYNRAIEGLEIGPQAGSCGTAAFTGHPVIVADIAHDPRWAAYRDIALAHGLRACWSLPVLGENGKVLGTLAMYYREPRNPSPEEFEAIRVAAHLTGIAIEHWQSQEALREREAEMKLAMEAAHMGIWYWDVPGDRIDYSETMGPLFGLARGAGHESAKEFLASVHPDDRERMAGAIATTLKQQEEYQNEVRVIWPDGSLHWIANRGVVMRDEQGSALRLVGVAMDITARKQLEATVAQGQIELEHLSRLHLIDSMAANLAHELNQPLAAVQYTLSGALERASKRTMRKSDLAEALRHAQGQAERAAAIVERVREFARRRGPDKKKLPLLETLEESLALVRVDAQRRRVKMLIEEIPEKLEIIADRVQLQQVLVNLIRNGMEAMDDTPVAERRITLSARTDGQGKVEIALADRGCGIDADTTQLLFRPFQTTRGAGLGLGLSICLNIIEAHGGRIWLEPNEHGGTIARFTLTKAQA